MNYAKGSTFPLYEKVDYNGSLDFVNDVKKYNTMNTFNKNVFIVNNIEKIKLSENISENILLDIYEVYKKQGKLPIKIPYNVVIENLPLEVQQFYLKSNIYCLKYYTKNFSDEHYQTLIIDLVLDTILTDSNKLNTIINCILNVLKDKKDKSALSLAQYHHFIKLAIDLDWLTVLRLIDDEELTEEIIWSALKNWDCEESIFVAPETFKEHTCFPISFVGNPSIEMQKYSVNKNPNSLGAIKNPSKEVIMEALNKNGWAIRYIDKPDNEMKQLAIKTTPEIKKFF